jgi:hypothetical protein
VQLKSPHAPEQALGKEGGELVLHLSGVDAGETEEEAILLFIQGAC